MSTMRYEDKWERLPGGESLDVRAVCVRGFGGCHHGCFVTVIRGTNNVWYEGLIWRTLTKLIKSIRILMTNCNRHPWTFVWYVLPVCWESNETNHPLILYVTSIIVSDLNQTHF